MKRIKNACQELKNGAIKKIKRIKKEHLIKEYFKNNTLFLVFVLTCVLESTVLRFFCMHSLENYLSWKAIVADTFVVTLVGALGYLIKQKNRFTYYLSFSIFFTAICVINSVYYTFYTSFASISMLSLTQYIGDVGDAVVENVLQLKDLVYVAGPLILIYTHYKLKKKNYYKKIELKSERRKKAFRTLGFSGFLLLLFVVTMTSLDVSRFLKQWNKEYIVMRYGIYVYQFNDVVTSVQPKINSMFGYDKAYREFNDYYKENALSQDKNEYSNIFEGKNIIVIHAESMMTNAIDLKFNNQEVSPNLNKIAKEGMFFSNFYSQVSVGTSSDSELTFNTSLLPTKSGTAFVSYSDRTYIGIPTLLKEKGYRVVLATKPMFPEIAVNERLSWLGFSVKDFDYVSSYENSCYTKPNRKYYEHILKIMDKDPGDCLMVGNDVKEDMYAAELGIDVFLIEGYTLNPDNDDTSMYKSGNWKLFKEYVNDLPKLN